jgi:hypothetical protein
MSLARWQATISDDRGNIVPLASVEVRRESPGAALVSVYSDRDGTIPLGNPFLADSEGFAAFHVVGGVYRVRAFADGFERIWRYVGIGTASEFDFGSSLIPSGAWDNGTSYQTGALVDHEGYLFASSVDNNMGNEPVVGSPPNPASDEFWTFVGISSPVNAVTSDTVSEIVRLTQAEYDALIPPDPETFYIIVSE